MLSINTVSGSMSDSNFTDLHFPATSANALNSICCNIIVSITATTNYYLVLYNQPIYTLYSGFFQAVRIA